jgi:hypothetical protein
MENKEMVSLNDSLEASEMEEISFEELEERLELSEEGTCVINICQC